MPEKTSKIGIISNQQIMRSALSLLVNTWPEFEVVSQTPYGKKFVSESILKSLHVLLIDSEKFDLIAEVVRLTRKNTTLKIIVLSSLEDKQFVLELLELGIHAIVSKNAHVEELAKAILHLRQNDFFSSDWVAKILRDRVVHTNPVQPSATEIRLTKREKDILRLICKEFTVKQIGHALALSENTVRNHRTRMMQKIGCTNVIGLVNFAYKNSVA